MLNFLTLSLCFARHQRIVPVHTAAAPAPHKKDSALHLDKYIQEKTRETSAHRLTALAKWKIRTTSEEFAKNLVFLLPPCRSSYLRRTRPWRIGQGRRKVWALSSSTQACSGLPSPSSESAPCICVVGEQFEVIHLQVGAQIGMAMGRVWAGTTSFYPNPYP